MSGTVSTEKRIDRRALVRRHNPVILRADPLSPLSIGNGRFAFTADITGLQTFPDFHTEGIPLSTQSHWGWHTFPNPENHRLKDALVDFDSYGRTVPYASNTDHGAGQWLRANPHRLGLGRIGFEFKKDDGTGAGLEDIEGIEQTLDLWSGVLTSRFTVSGHDVCTRTGCHPDLDMIAVSVESSLIAEGLLNVCFSFAYGSGRHHKEPEDWTKPQLHETKIVDRNDNRVELSRKLDNDDYHVSVGHSAGCEFEETYRHRYALIPSKENGSFEFTSYFSPESMASALPSGEKTLMASKASWNRFWSTGGAIDLSGCTDPRAQELERRIVLSQYLMAIQCAGSLPPQETGLTFNSWYGKFHLEMHWWHGVHFALWDRLPLLEKSLSWYQATLSTARETAEMQGYAGVRWPKMVGPDGREGSSGIGVFLIWQQPHPIYYAELCYRVHANREVLEKYEDMVLSTAEFMASYAQWDEDKEQYVLGPPVIPAQECYGATETMNPTFELQYWAWGLETAQKWRERLGMDRLAKWDHVIEHISPLPADGDTYLMAKGTWRNLDHPSLLAARGLLPGAMVDCETMRRTLRKVMTDWNWESTWGWDFPMTAMTAARVGEPDIALDALLMKTQKNQYLPNGHNYQNEELPIYLPGNGGLLTAVAMMAAGWEGAPEKRAPGFPDNGKWKVRWENLRTMP